MILQPLPLKIKKGNNLDPEKLYCKDTNSVEVYYLIFRST